MTQKQRNVILSVAMNFETLPLLKPFDKGLLALAERAPKFRFLVEHGGRVQPPKSPHRLIRLLTHKLQQKGPKKPTFKLGLVFSRDVHRGYSWATGEVYHITGLSEGHIVISVGSELLEIGFHDRFDLHAQVVRWERSLLPA